MPRTTIERACQMCGSKFRVAPSRLKHGRGLNCSPKCQYEARCAQQSMAVSLTCEGCGISYARSPSHADKARFCTRECRDIHWKGDKTPNWQDGSGVYKRGPHWHSIRRTILKRDNHECQTCGEGEPLHVHHIVPFRMFDDHETANHESNLISLCPPCHRKADAESKWVKVGDCIIKMGACGYAWELTRAMQRNGHYQQGAAA